MNCPTCGAAMQLKPGMTSFKCEYCHAEYFPDKDDEGVRVLSVPSGQDAQTAQACPVCKVPLADAAIASYRILYCATCRGMLIPMEEFQVLIDELRSEQRDTITQTATDLDDLHYTLGCPHCHQLMESHIYGGGGNVVINSCDNCSLNWLDHGELLRIVHAPNESRAHSSFVSSASAFGDGDYAPYPGNPLIPPRPYYRNSNIETDAGMLLIDSITALFRS